MANCQTTHASNEYIDLLKKVLTGFLYDESAWKVLDPNERKPKLIRKPVKYLLDLLEEYHLKKMKERGSFLVQVNQFDASIRNEGKDWPFIGYTMIGDLRLENIRHCVDDVLKNRIPGDFIETGVWRGGATIFMRALLKLYDITNRKVWVADSFEGLPPPKDANDGWDLSDVELLKVSLEEVKSNFAKFGLLDEQVDFLKGWFCDTLPCAPIQELAILRLDGDMYHSTMDALKNLYPKVSRGGYVMVDDYNSWPCCKKAVTDFLEMNSLKPEIKPVDWAGAYWQVE